MEPGRSMFIDGIMDAVNYVGVLADSIQQYASEKKTFAIFYYQDKSKSILRSLQVSFPRVKIFKN